MKFIEEDTYVCPSCGCMFKRNEIEVNKPELKNAIEEQNNIHCISCGSLGMDYMAKDLKVTFRATRK